MELESRIVMKKLPHTQTYTQPFNGPFFGTTQVGWHQKKHSPTHTHLDHQTSFINFLHLLRSIASSLFNLCAWQSFSTTALQVLIGLPPGQMFYFILHASLCRECFRDSSQDNKKIQCTLSMKPWVTLKNVLVHPKDREDKEQTTECVYKVPCASVTLVRQKGNLGSGYKNTDLKWSRKRIELSPEVIVQVHRLNLIDRH